MCCVALKQIIDLFYLNQTIRLSLVILYYKVSPHLRQNTRPSEWSQLWRSLHCHSWNVPWTWGEIPRNWNDASMNVNRANYLSTKGNIYSYIVRPSRSPVHNTVSDEVSHEAGKHCHPAPEPSVRCNIRHICKKLLLGNNHGNIFLEKNFIIH